MVSMNDNLLLEKFKIFSRSPVAVFGIIVLIIFVLIAIFANYLTPHEIDAVAIQQAFESPSSQHIFGTDNLGRDIFSRMIYATRISLTVGFATVLLAGTIGGILGAVAGYFGRLVETIIMRLADFQLTFPPLLLALVVGVVLGQGLINIIIVLSITTWPYYARLSYSSTLQVKQEEFVESAKAMGAKEISILFKHVIPNIISPLIVLATVEIARAIIIEASLSFLGLGVPPEIPTYGAMVSAARHYIDIAWWFLVFPGLGLILIVLGANLFGDGLNDILDPAYD